MKFSVFAHIRGTLFVAALLVTTFSLYAMVQGPIQTAPTPSATAPEAILEQRFDRMPITDSIVRRMQQLNDSGLSAFSLDSASRRSILRYDENMFRQIMELFRRFNEQFPSQENDFIKEITLPYDSKITFFGDIHGSWNTLIKNLPTVLAENEYLVFLGDYVDRGQYGLETLITLAELTLKYPQKVFLIRGNHEQSRPRQGTFTWFDSFFNNWAPAYDFGFFGNKEDRSLNIEIPDKVGQDHVNDVATFFNGFANSLPSALIIKNPGDNPYKILCTHGGVVRKFELQRDQDNQVLFDHNRQQVPDITKPLYNLLPFVGDDVASHLRRLCIQTRWTDFYKNTSDTTSGTIRGRGYQTSTEAAKQWMNDNNIQLIIRGHQHNAPCVKLFAPEGSQEEFIAWPYDHEVSIEQLEDKIITVTNAISLNDYGNVPFTSYCNLQLTLGRQEQGYPKASIKQGVLKSNIQINIFDDRGNVVLSRPLDEDIASQSYRQDGVEIPIPFQENLAYLNQPDKAPVQGTAFLDPEEKSALLPILRNFSGPTADTDYAQALSQAVNNLTFKARGREQREEKDTPRAKHFYAWANLFNDQIARFETRRNIPIFRIPTFDDDGRIQLTAAITIDYIFNNYLNMPFIPSGRNVATLRQPGKITEPGSVYLSRTEARILAPLLRREFTGPTANADYAHALSQVVGNLILETQSREQQDGKDSPRAKHFYAWANLFNDQIARFETRRDVPIFRIPTFDDDGRIQLTAAITIDYIFNNYLNMPFIPSGRNVATLRQPGKKTEPGSVYVGRTEATILAPLLREFTGPTANTDYMQALDTVIKGFRAKAESKRIIPGQEERARHFDVWANLFEQQKRTVERGV
jgi:calcineurin-like phosphoesterase family protein